MSLTKQGKNLLLMAILTKRNLLCKFGIYSAIANLSIKTAIALSKSIQIGEPDQQIELAKASGWES